MDSERNNGDLAITVAGEASPVEPQPLSVVTNNSISKTTYKECYKNHAGGSNLRRRRRFGTRFTGEQKEKMLSFAERLGWKIQRADESAVMEFCNETGVNRHVFKVWMHNNKNTLSNQQQHLQQQP